MDTQMFCFQCEQTAKHEACTASRGVCGKMADTAGLQDELTGALIGLARAVEGHEDAITPETDALVMASLFTTVTNVDFDNATVADYIQKIEAEKDRFLALADGPSTEDEDYIVRFLWDSDEDIRSLKSLILFGIRGMSAYAYHGMVLGYTNPEVNAYFYEALRAIGNADYGMDELLPLVLKTGEVNLKCMENLDKANTETYGTPEPPRSLLLSRRAHSSSSPATTFAI